MEENDKQNDYSLGVLEWTLCILLVAIVVITFVQVLSRYVLQTSLAWTEELARYLFIWLAALGAAYAFKVRSHFLIRFVVDKFSQKVQYVIGTFVTGLLIVFLAVFVWQAVLYTGSVVGQTAPGTGLSKAVPVSSAVVGGLLMMYYVGHAWLHDSREMKRSVTTDKEQH